MLCAVYMLAYSCCPTAVWHVAQHAKQCCNVPDEVDDSYHELYLQVCVVAQPLEPAGREAECERVRHHLVGWNDARGRVCGHGVLSLRPQKPQRGFSLRYYRRHHSAGRAVLNRRHGGRHWTPTAVSPSPAGAASTFTDKCIAHSALLHVMHADVHKYRKCSCMPVGTVWAHRPVLWCEEHRMCMRACRWWGVFVSLCEGRMQKQRTSAVMACR